MATDDGVAVAGASTVTVDGNDWAGKAYVFTRDSSNEYSGQWSQETVLDAGSNAGQGTTFGTSVAVDGNTIVVGYRGKILTLAQFMCSPKIPGASGLASPGKPTDNAMFEAFNAKLRA